MLLIANDNLIVCRGIHYSRCVDQLKRIVCQTGIGLCWIALALLLAVLAGYTFAWP